MVGKIDVHEEVDFPFGKMTFEAEEPAVKRLDAHAIDRCDDISSVRWSEGADFNPPAIAQLFKR